VRRDLVQRAGDSQDRRNKIITLTKGGIGMKALIMPWMEGLQRPAAARISSGNSFRLYASYRAPVR
jgi:hypothetical protein